MKKVLLGILFGIALAIPLSSVSAEVVSLVGKRIEGVLPIKVGDERAEVEAIVIAGVSYAPVRAVAELVGADIDFSNGEILLTPRGGIAVANEVSTDEEKEKLMEEASRALEEQRRLAEELMNPKVPPERQIEAIEERIALLDNMITLHKGYRDEKGITEFDDMISEWEAEKAALEAQLAETP